MRKSRGVLRYNAHAQAASVCTAGPDELVRLAAGTVARDHDPQVAVGATTPSSPWGVAFDGEDRRGTSKSTRAWIVLTTSLECQSGPKHLDRVEQQLRLESTLDILGLTEA